MLDALADLMILRGTPRYVRSDNGPGFIAQAVGDWIAGVSAQTGDIDPTAQGRAVICEGFNSKLRFELLSGEIFHRPPEARS